MSHARKQPTKAELRKSIEDAGHAFVEAGNKFKELLLTVNQKQFLMALVDGDTDLARERAMGMDEKDRQNMRGVAATVVIIMDEIEGVTS